MRFRLLGGASVLLIALCILFTSTGVVMASFVPQGPVMNTGDVKPGMKGVAYTVVKGEQIVSFPVSVVSVIPQEGIPSNLIMIKASGSIVEDTGGIAAGMSGSPVYIDGKLIGAIGYGWNFSDHRLGLVTPVSDMCHVFDWPDKKYSFYREDTVLPAETFKSDKSKVSKKSILAISGITGRAVPVLSQKTGKKIVKAGVLRSGNSSPVEMEAKMSPGDAVAAMLVWGDISVGATGTLSALSRDGRFLAFAHPFMNAGAVAFPLAKAYIHHVVPSLEAPFKIGSFGPLVGTITQDRPQGIGGKIGVFAPSVGMSLRFYDRDTRSRDIRRFHAVPDPFTVSRLVPSLVMGLVDNLWGRRGYGTAKTSLSIEGGGLTKGWSYTDYYFSDVDISKKLSQEIEFLLSTLVLNPFLEISPLGIHFSVEITENPRILYIEKISLEGDKFSPAGDLRVKINMRPYRGKTIERDFVLKIPETAVGPCQVVVRGGGLGELSGGLGDVDRSISSFTEMLKELDDRERYNEVIIELQCQEAQTKDTELPPVAEFSGELRRRKLKEKSMKVYRSDYYVEGSLQKSFIVSEKN